MACAAIIVAIGVDPTKRFMPNRPESGNGLSGLALLAVTVKFFAEPYQLMLVILNIFVGLQQAFFGSDFAVAFVSCAIGPGTVGFIMMTYGVSDAVGCVVTGYLAKLTGRVPLITTAVIVHTCLMTTLLVWPPQAQMGYVLYIFAVLWGLCDSIWMVQVNAYYGVLFKGNEEAAFSNFRLWESVGYIIAYIISPYLRTRSKTYLLLASMFVGVALYYIVEFKEYRIKKKAENKNKDLCYIREGTDNITFQHIE